MTQHGLINPLTDWQHHATSRRTNVSRKPKEKSLVPFLTSLNQEWRCHCSLSGRDSSEELCTSTCVGFSCGAGLEVAKPKRLANLPWHLHRPRNKASELLRFTHQALAKLLKRVAGLLEIAGSLRIVRVFVWMPFQGRLPHF